MVTYNCSPERITTTHFIYFFHAFFCLPFSKTLNTRGSSPGLISSHLHLLSLANLSRALEDLKTPLNHEICGTLYI